MTPETPQDIPKIHFKNSPKLSEHEKDQRDNEKRLLLVPIIEQYLANPERFQGKEMSVNFSETGVSSLVALLETPEEKLVLKIPLASTPIENEGHFLQTWEEYGVSVPHIVEEGDLEGHRYTLMEYIEAPTLSTSHTYSELVEEKKFVDIGQTLRKMHSPQTEGYGRVLNGQAEYATFADWLQGTDIQNKITYTRENKLLGEHEEFLPTAYSLLTNHADTQQHSTLCHNDLAAYNIFDTEPITVFDPDPRLNNGYIDLGRSIVIALAHSGLPETAQQIIEGYFGTEPYDKEVLKASILLNCCIKFPRWHSRENLNNIEKFKQRQQHVLDFLRA